MAPITRLTADYDTEPQRQTGSLAGLAVSLLLVVVGLYLIDALHSRAMFQDCVLSGHADCSSVLQP